MQQDKITDEIEQFLQRFNEQENTEPEWEGTEKKEIEEIDVYFVRRPKEEDLETRVDEERPPQRPRRSIPLAAFIALAVNLLLILSVMLFVIVPELTTTVTITVIPQVQSITLQSTAQLGKLLSPLTLSESQTVPTTGHGHQDARAATGSITFYNGTYNQQAVSAGTVLTSTDGNLIITDRVASIAAANPPNEGITSVSAHAIHAGSAGNIQALSINTPCCLSSVFAKNLTSFTGGQDERDFRTVAKADRDTAAATLKAKVKASMTAALQGQVTPAQELQSMPCTPIITADHGIGDEATTVQVTVSESCTAIAYNTQELDGLAAKLLSTQAMKKLGTGYMLYGSVKVNIIQAKTIQPQTVVLSFTYQGTYVYQLNEQAQQSIKTLIAGKPGNTALRLLSKLPGIHQVSISGIPDNQPVPDDLTHIHLLIIEG